LGVIITLDLINDLNKFGNHCPKAKPETSKNVHRDALIKSVIPTTGKPKQQWWEPNWRPLAQQAYTLPLDY